GLETLAKVSPPAWFMEGMAEYLSLGPSSTITNVWMRDASLFGKLPTIQQMSHDPDKSFRYRYGQSVWAFVGQNWGDETIGQIMNSVPTVGIERAFVRELGVSLEDLSGQWREDIQTRLLPSISVLDRPRKFAQAVLNKKLSDGNIFL